MKEILFYSPSITERIKYSSKFIFERLMGLKVTFTGPKTNSKNINSPCIYYGSTTNSPHFFSIASHPILCQDTIEAQSIIIKEKEGLPCFFESENQTEDLPFDLLGMTFYLLSRYEEYLPYEKDKHGRFSAPQSLAYQAGFLTIPLIDLWAQKLKTKLQAKYPSLKFPQDNYYFQPTYDIDHAWAFRYKGLFRTIGGQMNELLNFRFKNFIYRWQVLLNQKEDPYNQFSYLEKLHHTFTTHPIYFFLVGDYGTFDKNISFRKWAFRRLIKSVNEKYQIGVHPSYQSNTKETLISNERKRLEQVIGEEVIRSRQHFLKLNFPDTYRHLIQANIQEDYTMGYSSEIGFRASTAHDFLWFDLVENKTTGLLLFPFQVMDVTLKEYKKWSPEEALEKIKPIIDVCREVDGCFCTLWHNSSFAEMEGWKDWDKLYESVIEYASVQ